MLHRSTRMLLSMLVLAALAMGPWTVTGADTLPRLGDASEGLFTPEQEHRLGDYILRQTRATQPVLEDPIVQEYAEGLIYRLAAHASLSDTNLHVLVINTPQINAFAAPGGVVGINAGIFLNADSEDEAAAVLAHELAHLSQHHFERMLANSKITGRAQLAAMLASLAVAIAGNPSAGMAAMATTNAAAVQHQLAFSRTDEQEADRVGMQILDASGFDPHAMPDFFQMLLRKQQFASDPPQFLVDHPVTESRIADTRARADQLPAVPLHDSLKFQLMQARLRAGFFNDPGDAEAFFGQQYNKGDSPQQLAAGYGLALAEMRAGDFDKAATVLTHLQKTAPNQMWFRMAAAELSYDRKQYKQAADQMQRVLAIMPDNYAATLQLAQAELRADMASKARDQLETLSLNRPLDPLVWHLLAEAYGKTGDDARVHQARAEYYFLNGQGDKALEQIKYALDGAKDRFALYTQLRNRQQEMKKALTEKPL